ncbi:MAG TPA: prenyltransferase/squalene oxidase repeat-containing protein, partial [Steroidobacteraceae bacterium]|nr:prenyltransferase/squalene oxidase repeat-containing protein [Steroidobacteraceae bacterium]
MTRSQPQSVLAAAASTSAATCSDVGHRAATQPLPFDGAIAAARIALEGLQSAEGYWQFELQADCTIPAEYIMMMHFLGDIDVPLQAKIARFLRAQQASHGGWSLYPGGDFEVSCSVKAYFALKLAGDGPGAPHMVQARSAILARGGAATANVFTRIALALFGELPWHGVPYLPVEIVLLPRWFPFNLYKVSYWSRTVMVPLLILCTLKARARNPGNVHVRELFTTAPERERHYFRRPGRSGWLTRVFLCLDRIARSLDRVIPAKLRRHALGRAEKWMLARLNGEDGLGAIFPAMVNALEALVLLGYPAQGLHRREAKRALQRLLVVGPTSAYCQPCISPVWDTALAGLALQEVGDADAQASALRGLEWLRPRQLLDEPGDWRL